MKQGLCSGIAVTGGLLFILSLLWGFLFPPENTWTPEKSGRMSELSRRAHLLHIKVKTKNKPYESDEDVGEVAAEYREVTEELANLKHELESAHNTPKTVATAMRWSGLLLAVVGLIGLRALRTT